MRRVLTMVTLWAATVWLPPSCAPAFAHDQYTDWKIPGTSVSCCHEEDCRPVVATQDDDGNWIAWVDKIPVQIPASRILSFKAKDGRSHWCGNKSLETYCFTAGEPRS